jgi:hypothetical protein
VRVLPSYETNLPPNWQNSRVSPKPPGPNFSPPKTLYIRLLQIILLLEASLNCSNLSCKTPKDITSLIKMIAAINEPQGLTLYTYSYSIEVEPLGSTLSAYYDL